MFTILFVCSGNTCRSSMAEAICEKIIQDTWGGPKDIKVLSAGTAALKDMPASPEAVDIMKEKGIDIEDHRAAPLTAEMIREADLILTMTERHKIEIMNIYSEASDRIYTLREYALQNEDKPGKRALLEAAAELEKKEAEFYGRYGEKIEKLRSEYNELTKRLRNIERELTEIEEKFQEETRREREKIAEIEDGFEKLDIEDPIGQPQEEYRRCAEEIQRSIEKALKRFFREIDGE